MAPKPCSDCQVPCPTGLCAECKRIRQARRDAQRGTSSARGYGSDYQANRAKLLASQSQCQQCGSTEQLQADHIIPPQAGGSNELANLRIWCRKCNVAKSKYDKAEIAAFRDFNREHR